MLDSFHQLCDEHRASQRVVISCEDSELSLSELERCVDSLARVLPEGPGTGHLLLALPGGPGFTAVVLAALKTKTVVSPIPSRLKEGEGRAYCGIVKPDIIVVESLQSAAPLLANLPGRRVIVSRQDPSGSQEGYQVLAWEDILQGRLPRLKAVCSGLPSETAMVQFTSGSTSHPKDILISHANLKANLKANGDYLAAFRGSDIYCPVPQFHAMGGAVVLEHLLSGAAVHVSNRFLPGEDLARMRKFGCRALLSSPTYIRLLLRLGAFKRELIPGLEVVVLGTEPVDAALVDAMREALPGLEIHIRYGLSESVGTMARVVLRPGERLEQPGFLGRPLDGLELAEDLHPPEHEEPGEIRVAGPTVAIGELVSPQAWRPLVDEQGFLDTGDLGHRDAHGGIHLRGRKSSFLKSNGYRISPFEVESVLRSHEGVREAVVVGVPDSLCGERLVACLEPFPGASELEPSQLKAYCEKRLSPYKVPKEFHTLSPLPRTRAGKPNRRKVRAFASSLPR